MSPSLVPVLSFLSQLALNNDRVWFEAHRADYDRAREAVEAFVFSLFPALGLDRGSHKASYWFHRIYRDARFSKDKTPYKSHFSAVLNPGGKKNPGLGTYFHIQSGGETIVGGGLWAPEPGALKKFRLDMEDGPRAFQKILEAPEFRRHLVLQQDDKLTRVPKGFDPDHPAAELLKMRKVVAWRPFSDVEVLSPDFHEMVVAAALALRPFLHYLEESAGLVVTEAD